MNPWSLTLAGLTVPRLEEIRANLEERARQEFGDDVDLDPDGPLGQLIAVYASGLSYVAETVRSLYDSFDPDRAQGVMLDALSSMVGVTREPAEYTTGEVTLTGEAGVQIVAGNLVEDANGNLFTTLQTVVIPGTAPASGSVNVAVKALEPGAIVVLAGEVNRIKTPVPKWDQVINAADFATGQDAESDSALRFRREQSLQIIGAGPDQAIKARLLELPFVAAALVISNRTLATDVYGIPAKAFMAVLWPELVSLEQLQQVAQVIWESMPAGIQAFGSHEFDVTDAQGYVQRVAYSFASDVAIGIELDLTVNPNRFPVDGVDQVSAAVVALFNGLTDDEAALNPALFSFAEDGLQVGEDVLTLDLLCVVNTVPGVLSAALRLDRKSVAFPPLASANISIGLTEIATLDPLDLTVTVLP